MVHLDSVEYTKKEREIPIVAFGNYVATVLPPYSASVWGDGERGRGWQRHPSRLGRLFMAVKDATYNNSSFILLSRFLSKIRKHCHIKDFFYIVDYMSYSELYFIIATIYR